MLLHAQPLVLLHHHAPRDEALTHYDMLCLAVKAFDLIIDRSGFGEEVVRDTVAEGLRPLLRAMDEARELAPSPERHEAMADHVLAALRNDAHRGQPFEVPYRCFENGAAIERVLQIRLLKEVHGYSGQVVLRLTPEAINLFLSALELDIEDAQAANEAVVQSQLARGRFDQAIQSAQNARGQSLRYEEKIRRLLHEIRRDIDRIDWLQDGETVLDEALTHIQTRLRVEYDIVRSAEEKLDLLPEADESRATVAEVVQLMQDCRYRHHELHKRLMTARGEFLEQQARQAFTGSPLIEAVELHDEVLAALVAQPAREVGQLTERSGHTLIGPSAPGVLSLKRLIGWQLRPKRPGQPGEATVPEPELEELAPEPPRLDDGTQERAIQWLDTLGEPLQLSELIERLPEQAEPELGEALVLSVLRQFDPEVHAARVNVQRRGGGELRHARYRGDDLRVIPRGPQGGNGDAD